jgi:hypothetical protein
MSLIVRRGSYSYPSVPLGYREIVIEPNSAMEDRLNSPEKVEYIAMPKSNQVEPISERYPLADGNSPFRNTILLLVGLCVLVFTSGIVILVRAKKT